MRWYAPTQTTTSDIGTIEFLYQQIFGRQLALCCIVRHPADCIVFCVCVFAPPIQRYQSSRRLRMICANTHILICRIVTIANLIVVQWADNTESRIAKRARDTCSGHFANTCRIIFGYNTGMAHAHCGVRCDGKWQPKNNINNFNHHIYMMWLCAICDTNKKDVCERINEWMTVKKHRAYYTYICCRICGCDSYAKARTEFNTQFLIGQLFVVTSLSQLVSSYMHRLILSLL